MRFCAIFSVKSSKQGDCLTCNSGSPTKWLLQVTDMDSGRRIHVPVLKCRIPFSICKELSEFLLSWQVGQAKNHPRRSRHYKAFQGIFPITQKSSQKPTTTCGLASVFRPRFRHGPVVILVLTATEVLQLIDLFAGSDALSVNCVCPCQAPATAQVCSSSVCQKR